MTTPTSSSDPTSNSRPAPIKPVLPPVKPPSQAEPLTHPVQAAFRSLYQKYSRNEHPLFDFGDNTSWIKSGEEGIVAILRSGMESFAVFRYGGELVALPNPSKAITLSVLSGSGERQVLATHALIINQKAAYWVRLTKDLTITPKSDGYDLPYNGEKYSVEAFIEHGDGFAPDCGYLICTQEDANSTVELVKMIDRQALQTHNNWISGAPARLPMPLPTQASCLPGFIDGCIIRFFFNGIGFDIEIYEPKSQMKILMSLQEGFSVSLGGVQVELGAGNITVSKVTHFESLQAKTFSVHHGWEPMSGEVGLKSGHQRLFVHYAVRSPFGSSYWAVVGHQPSTESVIVLNSFQLTLTPVQSPSPDVMEVIASEPASDNLGTEIQGDDPLA